MFTVGIPFLVTWYPYSGDIKLSKIRDELLKSYELLLHPNSRIDPCIDRLTI